MAAMVDYEEEVAECLAATKAKGASPAQAQSQLNEAKVST